MGGVWAATDLGPARQAMPTMLNASKARRSEDLRSGFVMPREDRNADDFLEDVMNIADSLPRAVAIRPARRREPHQRRSDEERK
jgi:hypothetical protein